MPNQHEPGCKGQVPDEDEAIDAEACEFETLKISCKAEQKIKVLCDLQTDPLHYCHHRDYHHHHHHHHYHDHRQGGPRCLREAHG